MNEKNSWFYERDGAKIGPVSQTEIRSLISSSSIGKETLVWREGMEDWAKAAETEFFGPPPVPAPVTGPPPVIPPVGGVFLPRKVMFNPDYNFSIGSVLAKAWRLLISDFWPIVGFYAVAYMIFSMVTSFYITLLVASYPVMGGYIYYSLLRLRGEKGDFENLIDGFRRRLGSLIVLPLFVMTPFLILLSSYLFVAFFWTIHSSERESNFNGTVFWIIGLAIVGISLLVIVLTVLTWLATLLCLDCDIGWKEAMGHAWRGFKRRPFKLCIFSALSFILCNIGMLFFFVGVFVSGAWTTIAFSYIYEAMFGNGENSKFGT